MYILKNEENLSLYPVSREQLLSMLNDSFMQIVDQIGPFQDADMIVSLKSAGGGGANPGSFSISPLIISDHSPVESLYSFILHEMTHVLTYQWGNGFLPLFSEGISYLLGGIYLEEKYGNNFHAFVNAYLESREIKLIELLDPQQFFVAKESNGYISKISASFTGYLIEKYGIDSLKSTFEYGKGCDYEKAHYHRAKKHRAGCMIRWLSDLGKQSLDELEIEYLDYVKNCATVDMNPSFRERKDKDLIQRKYPRWHCYKCWRPNKETNDRCSHCSTKKQDKGEFSKGMNTMTINKARRITGA